MKINQIQQTRVIKYPKWEEVILDQKLLKNNIPKIWKRKEIVYFTLSAFLMSCSSLKLNKEKYNVDKNKINSQYITNVNSHSVVNYENNQDKASVAPVFVHGTGYGSGGCMSVAPAVFLSEDEALHVIEEEFRKAGIIFSRKNVVTAAQHKLRTTIKNRWKEINNKGDRIIDSLKTNITLDRYNTELNLGIEFFGKNGSYIFKDIGEGGQKSNGSSIWSFNAKSAAQKARDVMEDYGKINFGVFYDPTVGSRDKKYSINLLKKQVHDFLEWYKFAAKN